MNDSNVMELGNEALVKRYGGRRIDAMYCSPGSPGRELGEREVPILEKELLRRLELADELQDEVYTLENKIDDIYISVAEASE